MGSEASNIKKIKKIDAYPIPVQIMATHASLQGQILKLTPVGIMFEIPSMELKVGENIKVQFEIPVLHLLVVEQGVVVKMYNRSKAVLVEFHFHPLTAQGARQVQHFIDTLNRNNGTLS